MKALGFVLAFAVGCGGSSSKPDEHAVGTYIGGGSYLTGPSSCTYAGSVFAPEPAAAETGPRFIYTPGAITQMCGDQKAQIVAVTPTGATIEGPARVKVGKDSELLRGYLTANKRNLDGEAAIDWTLGKDCEGVATFGPVLGAQDTGGRDRTRKLVANAKGTCTVTMMLTTGSSLHESYKPQSFTATKQITIE